MSRLNVLIYMAALVVLSSCATSNHGSFIPATYQESDDGKGDKTCRKVTGESKQTWFLYLFPMGPAPSTDEAISDAKSQMNGARYLTDLSIDDRTYWRLGYSEQVIETKAHACK